MIDIFVLLAFVISNIAILVVLSTIIKSLQDQLNRQDDQLRSIRYGYVHGQQFSDLKEEVRQLENHFNLVVIDGPEGKEIRQAVYE